MKTHCYSSFLFCVLVLAARACDLCSVYTAAEAQGMSPGWFVGAASQFTHFGTLRLDGSKQPNDMGQRLDSWINQFSVGYGFNDRFTAQFTAPFIRRSFVRPAGFAQDESAFSGWGDASLVGRLVLLRHDGEHLSAAWSAYAGIKLPTGSSMRLREEFNEVTIPEAPDSGVHGHDLALGSGSTDGLLGTKLFVRHDRLLATGSFQYAARTRGSYGYRFADDVSWEIAPGAYLMLADEHTLAVQVALSGEHKGKDRFRGEEADDTGTTAVYLGPRLSFTRGTKLSAELELDLPIQQDNTALQLVPDYRIRGSISWRF